jgi:hypothetical protein
MKNLPPNGRRLVNRLKNVVNVKILSNTNADEKEILSAGHSLNDKYAMHCALAISFSSLDQLDIGSSRAHNRQ